MWQVCSAVMMYVLTCAVMLYAQTCNHLRETQRLQVCRNSICVQDLTAAVFFGDELQILLLLCCCRKVFTADEVADTVVGILDKLGVKEACVVGHSYGELLHLICKAQEHNASSLFQALNCHVLLH